MPPYSFLFINHISAKILHLVRKKVVPIAAYENCVAYMVKRQSE